MDVSVVIPCLNGEAFLAQTIRSVLNQTLPPIEIIVVDNGSTDSSVAVAAGFGAPVRVLSAPGGGASAARNAGMEAARGAALMFLDADDLLRPDALSALVQALEREPDAVACCPWERFELVAGVWRTGPPSCAPRRPGQDDLAAWLTGWYHPPCAVLWSRPALARSGPWDPQVTVNDDGDIMMRGLIAGNRLVRTRDGTAYYRRIPPGSVSLSGRQRGRDGLESRLRVIQKLIALMGERGLLARYRGPVGEALDRIAQDCGPHPDLLAACRDLAAAICGPAWARRAGASAGRLTLGYGRLRRRLGEVASGPVSPHPLAPPRRPGTSDRGGSAGATDEAPLVSVVIPTFNRAHLFPRAVDSVLAQSWQKLEILLVDDGSTDDTAQVAAAYADARLRYLRQPRNQGVAAARNRGMREARGDFIAFLDSDDEWMPEKLERQLAVFAAGGSRLGMVYTGVENVTGDGARTVQRAVHRGDLYSRMLLKNLIHGGASNGLIRRHVVETVGYFDEDLPAIEDYDYWLRIARFFEVDHVPDPLSRYYDQGHGDTAAEAERRSLNFDANMRARAEFHARYGHEMRRAGVEHLFLADSADRHLASPRGDRWAARRLVLRALMLRPRQTDLYPRLLPERVKQVLRPVARGLRRMPGPWQPTKQGVNSR